ncbi:hypothetical protein [Tolumonas lignilytica]|uniref:hypothetical protein n=1 Tax=Tolumonas lignilytica TaxID=1283284 RepID=UPI0004644A52|nr:hypothetical protein [Tolumonas lignilytica]
MTTSTLARTDLQRIDAALEDIAFIASILANAADHWPDPKALKWAANEIHGNVSRLHQVRNKMR